MGRLAVDKMRVGEIGLFVRRCTQGLRTIYLCASKECPGDPDSILRGCVGEVVRALAILAASEKMPADNPAHVLVRQAAECLTLAANGVDVSDDYHDSCRRVSEQTGIGLFGELRPTLPESSLISELACALLRLPGETLLDSLFFETMPVNWLGSAYQAMLAFRPSESGSDLRFSYRRRKGEGIYFTPPHLVHYIVESVVGVQAEDLANELGCESLADRLLRLRVLDPSVGGGDFLCAAIESLCRKSCFCGSEIRSNLAANCVYGVDVDPVAVEIARYCVWAASGYSTGISSSINAHIICADVLSGEGDEMELHWPKAFPEVFTGSVPGFDAVVGNPPYVASKNNPHFVRTSGHSRGQSDSYLLFLNEIISSRLVRSEGMFSMVLPDPMLVRGNAARVRRILARDWSIVSLVHLPGAFAEAVVANVIPVCRNSPGSSPPFRACRIEKIAERNSFVSRPVETVRDLSHSVAVETVLAQEGAELLYLLEQGPFADVIRRIHGHTMSLTNFVPPFMPLNRLNVKAIYRGEEIGKADIDSCTGDYPILMGGQSIRQYEILWEGRRIRRAAVAKPLERYLASKIVIQKSSGKVVAALDRPAQGHPGYVFPQSVYGVELNGSGMQEQYLLCLLNSDVMNEYVRRAMTGYKFLHPQLEIEDLRRLPVRVIDFITPVEERAAFVRRGIEVFETECRFSGDGVRFAGLGNLVAECLASVPEKSDVVHDLLVYLGGLVTELSARSRVEPGTDVTLRLEMARAAVESVVWRLYSPDPFQMSLPM